MTTIVLSYKGTCDGGPWKGQRVEAEFGFVPAPGGQYRWSDGVWHWKPQLPEPAI